MIRLDSWVLHSDQYLAGNSFILFRLCYYMKYDDKI